MVQLDTRLPLGIQQPDFLNALAQGTQNAGNQAALMRQAEGQNLFRQHGAAAAQGDTNALAQIGGFDPMMMQSLDFNRQENRRADQRLAISQEQLKLARMNTMQSLQTAKDRAAAEAEAKQAQALAREAWVAYRAGDETTFSRITTEIFDRPLPMDGETMGAIAGVAEGSLDFMKGGQPDLTSAMKEYRLAVDQGFPGSFIEYRQALAEASRPQTNVNVNTGSEVGTIPPGYELFTSPEGGRSMRPIPGGPVEREAQNDEEARGRQETLTARQLNPTIDDIVTARDLASTGIGRTGMMSGILRRVPLVGQGAVDLEATIDAIGSGISLENLNQMRQASPTGGALGNVSDKQSALLSEAFGSLRQSQSKELFLYNLARVENTLNDIVHGDGNGPPRHDLVELRRQLRGVQGGQQPAQQPAQPRPPGQGAIPIDPPPAAVQLLMRDPSPEALREFDEAFGEGAAARALGQ